MIKTAMVNQPMIKSSTIRKTLADFGDLLVQTATNSSDTIKIKTQKKYKPVKNKIIDMKGKGLYFETTP